MNKTKKQYEEYLNGMSIGQDSDLWIIGGTLRMYYRQLNKWGTAVRKYDPMAFDVGYNSFRI